MEEFPHEAELHPYQDSGPCQCHLLNLSDNILCHFSASVIRGLFTPAAPTPVNIVEIQTKGMSGLDVLVMVKNYKALFLSSLVPM